MPNDGPLLGVDKHKRTMAGEVGSADDVLEAAIEAGAEDVQSDENGHLVTCGFDMLGTVSGEIEKLIGAPETVRVVWTPTILAMVDENGARSIMKLVAALEDDDDVQAVFSNFEVDEETLKKMTAA